LNVRVALSIGIIALLSACGAAKSASTAAASSSAPTTGVVGQQAPAFSEPTSTGGTLTLASLKGKAVYLNFFASWCPPCNEEASAVGALQSKYGSRGLQVVGIDVQENAKKAEDFRQQHHLQYPAIIDPGTLRDAYNINGLPVHVFIDRTGIIKKIEIGELSPSEMEADIKQIL
jgi:cytochrome c biogenesis protein CcmG, thiol:disulfide interchange protein DsbE